MRALSLFSGIGGFDLALKRKGIELIGACEIDKFARQIYEKNFPGIKIYGNATKLNPKELPKFDILVAGFPCQPFSSAGLGKGFDDTRGTLIFELLRIVREKRPSIFIFENVKGLLSNQKGSTFFRILQVFEELGYLLQWQTINSSMFTAQNRERVFIVGYSRESSFRKILPIREPDETNEGARRCKQIGILEDQIYESAGRVYSSEGLARTIKSHFDKTGKYAICEPVLTPGRLNKRQHGKRFRKTGEPSFTVLASDKNGIFDGMRIRTLTPLECERLQGFPDNWTRGISDNQRYKVLGNAVTVPVIEYILDCIL